MMQNSRASEEDDRGVPPAAPRAGGRPRVLVAEDDDAMRQLLAKVLRADGYVAVECRDGIDLLEHLQASVGDQATLDFDAIISDFLMPGRTGLEILEACHDRTGFPPVILITAFANEGTYTRARKAGAVAVLDKPFALDVLLAKLHEIVPPPLAPGT
jgi:CheY-like chemotaxis protein